MTLSVTVSVTVSEYFSPCPHQPRTLNPTREEYLDYLPYHAYIDIFPHHPIEMCHTSHIPNNFYVDHVSLYIPGTRMLTHPSSSDLLL